MLSYNELRPGKLFVLNGEPHRVLEYNFLRMQQRKPVAQLKIKNLASNKVLNYNAHENEKFEEAELESLPLTFLYSHRGEYWFSDPQNPKNRISLSEDVLGNITKFLRPNTEVKALKFGEKIIAIELPIKIDLKVVEAPPAIRGDTAQGGTKIVELETGAEISVPLFINEDDIVRVNTETGEYVERVTKA
ncbi:MAG: elongation factor P [Parcubacteria group bacterium]|nr:elongation factor P [Parcubacteria group bacterium]